MLFQQVSSLTCCNLFSPEYWFTSFSSWVPLRSSSTGTHLHLCSISVFFSSFCCCLLFQLANFLLPCMSSSNFSFRSRNTYGVVFLGTEAFPLRFLVVLPTLSVLCVFSVSTYPEFAKYGPATWLLLGFYLIVNQLLGVWQLLRCTSRELLFLVTSLATLPSIKTPFIVRAGASPAVWGLGCFSSLQARDMGVLHLRAGFTHCLFSKDIDLIIQCCCFC